ncbi:hypothetical protein [Pseudarthrobacter sp. NS4]|uniref:hypothetical protein n=1 Tax=Pseudarthrobacter sp. NS4 TaxID=2973976 RepID=UPI0021619FF1|nr:hypothetical protein [Pseudarthrobacter sp. NS4]
MAHSQFDQFLQEATYRDQDSASTLDADSFYGLYTSWCHVSHSTLRTEHTFWAAMKHRVRPGQCLRMKGPAAADYILNSYRAVV